VLDTIPSFLDNQCRLSAATADNSAEYGRSHFNVAPTDVYGHDHDCRQLGYAAGVDE
jgi:hypothetical protein